MTKEKGRAVPLALAANAAAFAVGAAVGFLLAGWLRRRGQLAFAGWLDSFSAGVMAGQAGQVSLWSVLWDSVRWPLFLWLLGFTALGIWMIPLMFALRGFFLCFSVAALSGAAEGGYLLALLLFGLGGAGQLAVLFLQGGRSWDLSRCHRGSLLALPRDPGYWRGGGLVLGISVCIGAAEHWLVPILLESLAPLWATIYK